MKISRGDSTPTTHSSSGRKGKRYLHWWSSCSTCWHERTCRWFSAKKGTWHGNPIFLHLWQNWKERHPCCLLSYLPRKWLQITLLNHCRAHFFVSSTSWFLESYRKTTTNTNQCIRKLSSSMVLSIKWSLIKTTGVCWESEGIRVILYNKVRNRSWLPPYHILGPNDWNTIIIEQHKSSILAYEDNYLILCKLLLYCTLDGFLLLWPLTNF